MFSQQSNDNLKERLRMRMQRYPDANALEVVEKIYQSNDEALLKDFFKNGMFYCSSCGDMPNDSKISCIPCSSAGKQEASKLTWICPNCLDGIGSRSRNVHCQSNKHRLNVDINANADEKVMAQNNSSTNHNKQFGTSSEIPVAKVLLQSGYTPVSLTPPPRSSMNIPDFSYPVNDSLYTSAHTVLPSITSDMQYFSYPSNYYSYSSSVQQTNLPSPNPRNLVHNIQNNPFIYPSVAKPQPLQASRNIVQPDNLASTPTKIDGFLKRVSQNSNQAILISRVEKPDLEHVMERGCIYCPECLIPMYQDNQKHKCKTHESQYLKWFCPDCCKGVIVTNQGPHKKGRPHLENVAQNQILTTPPKPHETEVDRLLPNLSNNDQEYLANIIIMPELTPDQLNHHNTEIEKVAAFEKVTSISCAPQMTISTESSNHKRSPNSDSIESEELVPALQAKKRKIRNAESQPTFFKHVELTAQTSSFDKVPSKQEQPVDVDSIDKVKHVPVVAAHSDIQRVNVESQPVDPNDPEFLEDETYRQYHTALVETCYKNQALVRSSNPDTSNTNRTLEKELAIEKNKKFQLDSQKRVETRKHLIYQPIVKRIALCFENNFSEQELTQIYNIKSESLAPGNVASIKELEITTLRDFRNEKLIDKSIAGFKKPSEVSNSNFAHFKSQLKDALRLCGDEPVAGMKHLESLLSDYDKLCANSATNNQVHIHNRYLIARYIILVGDLLCIEKRSQVEKTYKPYLPNTNDKLLYTDFFKKTAPDKVTEFSHSRVKKQASPGINIHHHKAAEILLSLSDSKRKSYVEKFCYHLGIDLDIDIKAAKAK